MGIKYKQNRLMWINWSHVAQPSQADSELESWSSSFCLWSSYDYRPMDLHQLILGSARDQIT